MLKKLIILQLTVVLVLSLIGCNSGGPTIPQPKIMVPITIKYNQNEMPVDNSNSHSAVVGTNCSWEAYSYQKMVKDKTAEGWFLYKAQDVEAPNKYTPDTVYGYAKFRFRITEPGLFVSDGAYVNDKKAVVVIREAGTYYFVFWVNCQGTIRTTYPQGN